MGIILGEQVKKIVAENKGISRQMTIANNIKLTDVHKQDVRMGAEKQQGLAFDFLFSSVYGETSSKIEVEGSIYYGGDKKELDEIEKAWKEKKAMDQKVTLAVNNRALELGFLQSIALANQLHLPIPIQLPRFVTKEQADTKKAAKAAKAS